MQDVVDPDRVSPLQGLYGTREVADAILFGNEITRTTNNMVEIFLFNITLTSVHAFLNRVCKLKK